MKMRHLVSLVVVALVAVGCAGVNKRGGISGTNARAKLQDGEPTRNLLEAFPPEKKARYVGVRGYLNRPPIFADKKSESAYQRCLPIEVVSVEARGKNAVLWVRQNGKALAISGLNRKSFVRVGTDRLPLLEKHFVRELDWAKPTREVASYSQKLCAGQTWRDMPDDQFSFIYGDPEARQKLSTERGQFDVWTYVGADKSSKRYYYFYAGYLHSWQ